LVKGFVFDIDGTLIRGHRALPGAAELLRELRRRGLALVFLSNDSQETPQMWSRRLGNLGLDLGPSEIITAAILAAEAAATRFPGGKILAVGDAALSDALRSRQLRLLKEGDAEQADCVVMGMDSTFDQRRLLLVCKQIWGGAFFIATNEDRRRPAENGYVPGTGPMVKAVAWASGVEPLVVGKPSANAALSALEKLGLPAAYVAMVGDQPETDIAMAKALGMMTILASNDGKTRFDPASLPPAQRPDLALAHLMELLAWLDKGQS
jgi:HAD superfamily hydrolase (TIGR01450 family)